MKLKEVLHRCIHEQEQGELLRQLCCDFSFEYLQPIELNGDKKKKISWNKNIFSHI